MAMIPEQLLSFTELFYSKNIALMRNKNADYGAGTTDAHANFKMLEGISGMEGSTEIGFLTRMLDKMARVISFVKKGELKVADESVTDSLSDLANYAALFAAYLSDQIDVTLVAAYKEEVEKTPLQAVYNPGTNIIHHYDTAVQ